MQACFALVPVFAYLVGSSFNSISISMAAERGAGHPLSLLMLIPTYTGHFFAGKVLRRIQRNSKDKDTKYGEASFSTMILPVLLHIVSSILYSAAISLAGSSLYQVCYASAPVFSIIYTKILLKKNTSVGRIFAVSIIIIGLIARVYVASSTEEATSAETSTESSTESPVAGAFLTFACAAGFSLCNILGERSLNPPQSTGLKKLRPADYLTAVGWYGLIIGGIGANVIWTWPRWEQIVVEPMAAAGLTSFFSPGEYGINVALCFFINMISGATVNISYFVLIVKHGVVTMAVLSAMCTIFVSVISHMLFCSEDATAQCESAQSACASFVVITGVLLYAFIGPSKSKDKLK